MEDLKSELQSQKCFKFICGASNRDTDYISKISAVFFSAGGNFIDISPYQDAIEAVIKGQSISKTNKRKYICISVTTNNDKHISKAQIISNKCAGCLKCFMACPQRAINTSLEIDEKKCVGCGKCLKSCPNKCIILKSSNQNINEILDNIDLEKVDCIELHVNDFQDGLEKWEILNNKFSKNIGISINRNHYGDEQIVSFLKNILKNKKDNSVIIQADGIPISGGENTFYSTLQAVSTAQIIQREIKNQFILLAGGTNFQSMKLAKQCNLTVNGVAMGSFARKYLEQYLNNTDLLKDIKIYEKAVIKAQELINNSFY